MGQRGHSDASKTDGTKHALSYLSVASSGLDEHKSRKATDGKTNIYIKSPGIRCE